jgi:hypothetical protein
VPLSQLGSPLDRQCHESESTALPPFVT